VELSLKSGGLLEHPIRVFRIVGLAGWFHARNVPTSSSESTPVSATIRDRRIVPAPDKCVCGRLVYRFAAFQ
jgi:hypothetical protein